MVGPIYNGKFDDYITFFVQQPSSVTYFLGATHKIYRIPLPTPINLKQRAVEQTFSTDQFRYQRLKYPKQ